MHTNNLSVVDWANGRGADELRTWVRKRLGGDDALWPTDRMSEDPPHYLVDVLLRHPGLRPESHAYLMDAIYSLARECLNADGNKDDWDEAAIIELLLILPVALRGTRYEPDARRLLASALSKLKGGKQDGTKVESHALRSLLELGLRETTKFWLSKDIPDDPLRNTIVCQALLKLDQQSLFQWLGSREGYQLEALMKTLGRALRRRCEADLRFAKTLRMILKGRELHSIADEITQIGVASPSNPASVPILRRIKAAAERYEVGSNAVQLEITGLDTGEPELLYPVKMIIVLEEMLRTLNSIKNKPYRVDQQLYIASKLIRALGYRVSPFE